MEVDSCHSAELNDAAIKEVEENKSFMHFVESYERAYTYSEEHSESGKCEVISTLICVHPSKEKPHMHLVLLKMPGLA